jgi:protein phosphatase methylesterase 1
VPRKSPQSGTGAKKASVLVCHHGAGSSGTTFAALAKEVQEKSSGELGILAFDARGHGTPSVLDYKLFIPSDVFMLGKTTTSDTAKELELSFANLQQDFLAMIKELYPEPKESPDLVVSEPLPSLSVRLTNSDVEQLLGHSMGASPIISSAPVLQKLGYKVVGVIVLDVVEGELRERAMRL